MKHPDNAQSQGAVVSRVVVPELQNSSEELHRMSVFTHRVREDSKD